LISKDIVILYHGDCPDGFGGAWAAHKKFGSKAEYIPVHHQMPPPQGLTGKEIYLIDFAYPEDVMGELLKNNQRVTAIDHHVSAEKSVKLTQDYIYDIRHSGSVLAWKYFHSDKPVPMLLSYVEDRDLWKFNVEGTREIGMYVDTFNFDFEQWDKLSEDLDSKTARKECFTKGAIMLRYEEKVIQKIIDNGARLVDFEGYETHVVNANGFFASQMGEALIKRKPPIAIIWSETKRRVSVSLRSDGSVDVSKIAAKFGGGGHKESSGFRLSDTKNFPWKDKNI